MVQQSEQRSTLAEFYIPPEPPATLEAAAIVFERTWRTLLRRAILTGIELFQACAHECKAANMRDTAFGEERRRPRLLQARTLPCVVLHAFRAHKVRYSAVPEALWWLPARPSRPVSPLLEMPSQSLWGLVLCSLAPSFDILAVKHLLQGSLEMTGFQLA